MRKKLLVLSAFILIAAGAPAHAQSLEGTWLTVLDVHGIVWPHLEELRIGRDGSVATAIYGIRDIPECADKLLAATGACAPSQPHATGKLAVDSTKQTLAVRPLQLSATGMAGLGTAEDQRLARDLFGFGPGEPWTFRREATALVMARRSQPVIPDTELDGSKAIVIEKWFYAVDPAFAGDLVALAIGGEFSLVKLACAMPYITGGANSASEFRALMRDIAAVTRKREQLFAATRLNPSPSAAAKLGQVFSTLGAKSKAPAASDVAATASALGATVQQVQRFLAEIAMRPKPEPVDTLLFSPLKPNAAEISECHKRYFE